MNNTSRIEVFKHVSEKDVRSITVDLAKTGAQVKTSLNNDGTYEISAEFTPDSTYVASGVKSVF